MSIAIQGPSGRLAELQRLEVSGLPGLGSYTLVLILNLVVMPPKSETWIRNVTIRVDWGDNTQRMIGVASPEEGPLIRISEFTNHKQLFFRLILTPAQLEAIEARRNGGEFKLTIWITGEVLQGEKREIVTQSGVYVVRQQDWVETLGRMEYRRAFLYEIPLLDAETDDGNAAEIIRKAQHHLLRGNYDECVAECRKLLEACSLSESDLSALNLARTKFKGDKAIRESMDLPERFAVLRDALVHTTHLAHHHNSGPGYSRDQAQRVLGASILFLRS